MRSTTNATCWALQASEFARLIGDTETRREIHRQYTDILLPGQLGLDGSFPKELVRTKPYSYSIFNFDVMACCASHFEEWNRICLHSDLRMAADFAKPPPGSIHI